jgi:hypothetical protein
LNRCPLKRRLSLLLKIIHKPDVNLAPAQMLGLNLLGLNMKAITLQALLAALRELEGGTFALQGTVVVFRANADDCCVTVRPNTLATLSGDGVDDSLSPETIALFE